MESEPAKSLAALQDLSLIRVAVITSRGDPIVVPVRFHFDGQAVYFGLPQDSPILLSIKANRRVSLVGDEDVEGKLKGTVIQGLAQAVRGQTEVDRAAAALREKYPEARPGRDQAMVRVVPLRVLDLEGRPS